MAQTHLHVSILRVVLHLFMYMRLAQVLCQRKHGWFIIFRFVVSSSNSLYSQSDHGVYVLVTGAGQVRFSLACVQSVEGWQGKRAPQRPFLVEYFSPCVTDPPPLSLHLPFWFCSRLQSQSQQRNYIGEAQVHSDSTIYRADRGHPCLLGIFSGFVEIFRRLYE